MLRFVVALIRPYRRTLVVILLAMLVETVMNLAGPWPLKIILDNVVGDHKMTPWLHRLSGPLLEDGAGMHVAALAALAFVAISMLGAIASYIDNYYTESVGQWVAHDLRIRIYDHLQRMSLSYFDKQQTGIMLSTITSDVATVQNFASSNTLDLLVDVLTIAGVLGLMFWLNWDFALIAVAVTPFLLMFVSRFKKAVKKATHQVRLHQADIVSVVQQGLESVRVVKAFGRESLEDSRLGEGSHATVAAALKARRGESLLSPIVSVVVALCTAVVLWRGAELILRDVMTVGVLTVFLAYLNKFFKPVQDLAKNTNAIAQATVALERIQRILDTDEVIRDRRDARTLEAAKGTIAFQHVAFGYDPGAPVLKDVTFRVEAGQKLG